MNRASIPLFWRPYLIGVSYGLIVAFQGVFFQTLWWQLSYDPLAGMGWQMGFLYSLFCLFVSGVHLICAFTEDAAQQARRWGCRSMEEMLDPGAIVCRNILNELLHIRGGERPKLFLVFSEEINAFAFKVNGGGALFITRGAIAHLSRFELKVLMTRQLLHLRDTKLKSQLFITLAITGLSQLFFSGSNLLRHASFGRFETRPNRKAKGHPLYFLGIIPLILGLPGWWMSRLFLLWIDPSYVFELDDNLSQTPENRRELCLLLQKIPSQPLDDCPPSLWPIRVLGLHHEGYLESILPLQPSLNERLERLKARSH